MSKTLANQLSFSGGEFSPLLDARVDHPKYQQACRQMQNMIALKQGGATRRPGTLFNATTKYHDTDVWQYAVRLMKFSFSPTTSFILEFGHQYIRFYSNRKQVTLNYAPVWSAATPYIAGNFVQDPGDANRIYYCTNNVTSTTQPHSDPSNWTLQSIYEIPSPYEGKSFFGPSIFKLPVWTIIPCQINDVVYLVHPDYPPYKLTRLSDTNWTLAQVTFLSPPLLEQNVTGVFIGPSATTGSINLSANAAAWVAATYYGVGQSVNPGGTVYTCIVAHVSSVFATDLANGYWKQETIFANGQVGTMFQLGYIRDVAYLNQALTANAITGGLTASGSVQFQTYGTWAADVALQRSDDAGETWSTINTIIGRSDHNADLAVNLGPNACLVRLNVTNYTASTGTPRVAVVVPSAFVFGLVRITGVSNAYTATAVVVKQLPSSNTTKIWNEGAFSVLRGYPRSVSLHQQRLVFGGTTYEPQRIWGSVTNDLENFTLGDQSLATDSYVFDIAAIGRGPIRWLLSQVDLFAGFAGAEWVINSGLASYGGAQQPITPVQINASEHSSWGSPSGLPPAVVGNSLVYTQRAKQTLQQMVFSALTNKYASADLTWISSHLFNAGICQIDYQPQFHNQGIIWVTTASGSLCGMTYEQESGVFAWHRHITGYNPNSGGIHAFESVAVIDGINQDDDEVWVVAYRGVGGQRCIELMNPNNWEADSYIGTLPGVNGPDIKQAIYVDSAITYVSIGSNVIPGLSQLEGQTVIALLNGNIALQPVKVSGGTATFPDYAAVAGDVLQVGLPIYYAVQPMRLDLNPQRGILIGFVKALSRVYLRLFNSLGGNVGNGGNQAAPIQYRLASTPLGQGPPIFTGQKDVDPFGTNEYDPQYVIQGNDPFPLTILASSVRLGVEGSP